MFLNPILITIFTLTTLAASQCCSQLSQLSCIKCPENMHLYRNNCIYNLPNCVQYLNGFDCIRCDINYQLIKSQCRHVRLAIDPQRVSNYTPYLQSAIKPNLLFNQALDILANNTEVWSDWLEEFSLTRNDNSSGRRDISKEAASIQKRMMKGKKSLLHYIYTADYHLNGLLLNLFRLTYQVGTPPGFADILVAIQTNEGKVDYLQIVQVRINELKLQGWQELSTNDQVKVEKQLLELFSIIDDQLLVKGWGRAAEKGFNFTIFELDDVLGVVAYSLGGREQDLKRIGLNLTIPNGQNGTESSREQTSINNTNTINNTKQENKKNDSAKDKQGQQQQPNQDKSSQTDKTDSKNKSPTQSSTVINNATNSTLPKQNTTNLNSPEQQILLDLSTIQNDDTLMAGYAIAIKFHYVSRSALIEGTSLFAFNSTYCMYFLDNSTYYQLMFHLNSKKSAFQIVSFSASKKSLITAAKSPSTTNSSGAMNKAQNATSNSTSKNIVIKTNKTSINATTGPAKKPQTINSSTTVSPRKDTTNQIKPATSTNTPNQNTTECSQSQSRSASIDITNQISEDAYMPKINLLLTKMYADTLQDSRIGEVSYSWAVDVKTKVSSLTYNIIYLTSLNEYYQFEVQIVNNQIKFSKVPANIKQSGTSAPIISKNKKISLSNSTANKQSESTANKQSESGVNKSNETQNDIVSPTGVVENPTAVVENKDNRANPFSDNNKINTFFEDSLLVNITQGQAKPTESPPASTQNNLNSEQKKNPQGSIEPIKKPDNESSGVQVVSKSVSGQGDHREVSASDFAQNPKYKPIVDIVCGIKRVPVNASFIKMQEWTIKEYSYYSILMVMNYSIPLNNGSSQKLFYFEVKVNTSSYVNIIKYNISYCCTQNSNTLPSNHPEPSANKLVLLKAVGAILQLSPYSHALIAAMRQGSLGLGKMTAQMMSNNQAESYAGIGECFWQRLRFKDSSKVLCYEFNYCVPLVSNKLDINGVLIRSYGLIGCSDKKEDLFLYSLLTAQFKQTSVHNKDLDQILAKMYNKTEIAFKHYQQYSNFYYANFIDPPNGNLSFLYDSTNQIFLSYAHSAAIQTATTKVFDQLFTQLVYVEVKKVLALKKGTFQIILIRKDKLTDKISLISIYVVEKIEFWGAPLQNLYYLQAKYDQTVTAISILDHKQMRVQPVLPQINTKILPKMYQVPLMTVYANKKLGDIINKTNLNYKSFMQLSRLQAVLMPSQLDLQNLLNNSLTNETTIKIIVAKKYSDYNFGSYTITLTFHPATNYTDFRGIEVVSSDVVRVANCRDSKQQLGLPSCAVCNEGYRVVEGKCVGEIGGCSQYHNSYCIDCSSGQISQSLGSCQMGDSEQSLLKAVNTYLLEVVPTP